MDQLTQEQAEKLAAHIRESVAKEVAAEVASFNQQMTTNSQRLHDMSQQYAQVGSTLSQMGVNINAAEAQAKADMMDAANKLVMNRYAGHGYFFPTAGWAKDQHKIRHSKIEKAKEYCPARLDPHNTTVWFNKVFADCSQIPR